MDQIKIGSFLRELRKEKGFTQEQLAEKFGVSGRTVSRWENGNNMPDISILVELADYYNVDIRELIDGERKSEDMDKQTKEIVEKVVDYTTEDKEQIIKKTLLWSRIGIVTLFLAIVISLYYTGNNTFVTNFRDELFWVTGLALLTIMFQASGKAGEIRKNKKKQRMLLIIMMSVMFLLGLLVMILIGAFGS